MVAVKLIGLTGVEVIGIKLDELVMIGFGMDVLEVNELDVETEETELELIEFGLIEFEFIVLERYTKLSWLAALACGEIETISLG